MAAETSVEEDAERAMALWEDGNRDEAAALYTEVIARCPPGSGFFGILLGELATLLGEMGRDDEALVRFREALEAELKQGGEDAAASVALARWSLGNHALKLKDAALALQAVSPALGTGTPMEWALRAVEAEAHWALGAKEDALAAARLALRAAKPERVESLRARLAAILAEA